MKIIKIVLIMMLFVIAGKGFSQQSNSGGNANEAKTGIIKADQETLNPTLISESNRSNQNASPLEGSMQSGQPDKTQAASGSADEVSPTLISSTSAQQKSSVNPVKTENTEFNGPSPTEIHSGNKQPETK
jgi:hypothetical protein